MELFAADGHDAGGCERVTGKSGMRPCRGWLSLSNATLYGELGLVNLVGLIPSIGPHHARTSS